MGILKKAKKIVDNFIKEQHETDELFELKKDFDIACKEKAVWDTYVDEMEQKCIGDRSFGNTRSAGARNEARTLIKLFRMLVEYQVDLNIPDAVFKALKPELEEKVKILQAGADYTIRCSDLDEINSMQERLVKIDGTVGYKVVWDNDFIGNGFRGKPVILPVHIKNLIPAAGSTNRKKVRIWYHVENETLAECKLKFGKIAERLPEEGTLFTKYDTAGKEQGEKMQNTTDIKNQPDNSYSKEHPMARYTIIEKWYYDDDNDVCCIIWSGDVVLRRIPKFYRQRKMKYGLDDDGNQFSDFELDETGNETFSEYDQFVPDDGYMTEQKGMAINPETGMEEEQAMKMPKFTMNQEEGHYGVKNYVPMKQKLPFVIQYNIPRTKSINGISDGELSVDTEESIKKMTYKIEESILKSSTKILYNKQMEKEAAEFIDNKDLTKIGVNDVNNFKTIDFIADVTQAQNWMQYMISLTEKIVGINQAYQGISPGASMSGKALEGLMNQSSEKISIKVNEKNIAYKELYELVCDFLLCFSNGTMPFRIDKGSTPEYGTFNKYDMLYQNENGEWIYPDYDIEITAESSFPKTKTFLFDITMQLAQGGYMEATPANVLMWTIMSKIGFPNAELILQKLQEQVDMAMQEQQMQQEQAMAQQQQSMQQEQVMQQEEMAAQQQQMAEEQKVKEQELKDKETKMQMDSTIEALRVLVGKMQGHDAEIEKVKRQLDQEKRLSGVINSGN